MKDKILEYFLKYVKVDTMSQEGVNMHPSTQKQFTLAKILVKDLEELGLKKIKLFDKCFVTGVLESNCGSSLKIGFLAHMDTIPGFSGTDVKPNVIYNYDGNDIPLKGISLTVDKFPYLKDLKGKTIITTDGTTVLGADDKAGIANIMGMLYYYKTHPEVKHVNIHVAFTPDEEIGGGIDEFNIEDFDADYAYTVDGLKYNELNYENFNAASAKVVFHGFDIHPGDAKGKMINASRLANEFDTTLSQTDRPELTEGYEGFNHLCEMKGECGYAELIYILRNHDKKLLEKQKDEFRLIASSINKKYGEGSCELFIEDSYSNMKELIMKDPRCVERAKDAMLRLNITPVIEPVRGGTDGARLTQMGLNTPNIGTGGYNCHGPYEMACLEEMEIVANILIEIAKN